MTHSEIVSLIWGVANLIRDTFKRGKYQDVILPLTVLRRLDCVLAPTKGAVLQRQGEIQQNIDMESYRIQQTSNGKVALERSGDRLEPIGTKEHGQALEDLEALSLIIADLNERFGIELGPEHRVTLGRMMERLEEDAALEAAAIVRYLVDGAIETPDGRNPWVRTVWQIDLGSDYPRFITAYPRGR